MLESVRVQLLHSATCIQSPDVTGTAVDFYDEAYGGFAPHRDEHAAVKFALAALATRRQLARLEPLLADPMAVSGVMGEPGWELERRYPHAPDPGTYAGWPAWADYRAYVDPEEYELAHPEAFYSARAFAGYLWVTLAVQGRRHPEDVPLVRRLLAALPAGVADGVEGRPAAGPDRAPGMGAPNARTW